MKSVNHWFTPEDFLHLMKDRMDRRITLHQYLAYTDGTNTTIFHNAIDGIIADESRGRDDVPPICKVTMLNQDGGKTIGEVFEQSPETFAKRYKTRREVWHELMDWYTKQ